PIRCTAPIGLVLATKGMDGIVVRSRASIIGATGTMTIAIMATKMMIINSPALGKQSGTISS
ncbi:MAG: hypothetical protein ABI351_07675, partial [Herbaspirillum sp.]